MKKIELQCEITPEAAGFRTENIEKMDNLLEGFINDKKYLGASYMLVRDGKTFLCKSMGALRGFGEPGEFKPDTIYSLASITKMFTAVAIMQLIENAKIYLEQPVSTIIKEFDNDTHKAITIFQLLTHTSGIAPDPGIYFEPYPRFGDWEESEDWIKKILSGLPHGAPGTIWSYSSRGFMILGEIVSQISGMDFDEYVMENIVKPLGMNRTFFFVPEALQDEVCVQQEDELKWLKETRADLKYPGRLAAGALYSTLEDLAKFGQMLMDQGIYKGVRILSRRATEAMTKNQLGEGLASCCWEATGQLMQYGLGLHTKAQNILSRGSFCHEGAGRSGFYIDPNERFMAIYFEPLLTEDWDYLGSLGLRNLMWSGLE